MEIIDYKLKYLKYKEKYLKLKAIQSGGAYSEESRGYKKEEVNGKQYPPCFKYSGPSRNIYDKLMELGLLDKYMDLMNVHSILLCTEMDVRDKGKDCISSIKTRLDDLDGKPSFTPSNLVKNIFKSMKRDKMLEFMTKNSHQVDMHVIGIMNSVSDKSSDIITKLLKEAAVTSAHADELKKMNDIFMSSHFRSIARACNPTREEYKSKSPKPAAKKPAAKKPTAKKPAAKKTAAKKPAAKKPAKKKPAAKKK